MPPFTTEHTHAVPRNRSVLTAATVARLTRTTKQRLALSISVASIGAAVVADKLRHPTLRTGTDVPAHVQDITASWLTDVLQAVFPGVTVMGVSVDHVSSGTSVRARLHLRYGTDRSELPATMFVKSTPTLTTRIANGLTGTAPTEAGFYQHLRPQLDLQAPQGYHSAFNSKSWRSVQIIEDLVATKGATFCSPARHVTFDEALQIVHQLATLHGQGTQLPEVTGAHRPSWLCTYPEWWRRALSVVNVKRSHLRAVADAVDDGILPPELRGRGQDLWDRFQQSVQIHRNLPHTLIHGDVHLGNWYVTADGAMGLCDWQCISAGHWSRDVAYALASALNVEQRRAWERDLIQTYLDILNQGDSVAVDFGQAWQLYRLQLFGALTMWTPTYHPPPLMPNMQPTTVTQEMLRRIGTAIVDLDAFTA